MTDPDCENTPAAGGQGLEWREGDMPYSQAFGDHFYSTADGRLECGHVFLAGNDLQQRWQTARNFRIGELGFGTGLNLCETWRQWQQARILGAHLDFVSFELFPMQAAELDRALSHWPQIEAERRALVAAWPETPAGHVRLALDAQTTLTVVCGPALQGVAGIGQTVDAWFLDGFSPAKNADMWSPELMRAVFDKTVDGGTFATYAAAGFVRRNLIAAGFAVERVPGFAGKREMLRGVRPETGFTAASAVPV
jgi:tRNA U34 5-methylaminomethyl-2-thiouridine-forming methyltransferase MnmC